jgi:hypothetical protein
MTTAAAGQGNTDAAAAEAAAAAAAAASKTPEQVAQETKAAEDAKAATDAAAKKAADDAAAKAAADAEAAKSKPPAKYEFKKPDGSDYFLTDTAIKEFEARARAKGWNQEQAQAVLEEESGLVMARSNAWRAETEADPTWGGEKLAETRRLADLALDKVAPKDDPIGARFRALMLQGAAFNELSVVATLARLGKMMAEDTPLVGGAGAAKKGDGKNPSTLYDHPTSIALNAESTKGT